jgi:hypothetical protein
MVQNAGCPGGLGLRPQRLLLLSLAPTTEGLGLEDLVLIMRIVTKIAHLPVLAALLREVETTRVALAKMVILGPAR